MPSCLRRRWLKQLERRSCWVFAPFFWGGLVVVVTCFLGDVDAFPCLKRPVPGQVLVTGRCPKKWEYLHEGLKNNMWPWFFLKKRPFGKNYSPANCQMRVRRILSLWNGPFLENMRTCQISRGVLWKLFKIGDNSKFPPKFYEPKLEWVFGSSGRSTIESTMGVGGPYSLPSLLTARFPLKIGGWKTIASLLDGNFFRGELLVRGNP